MGCPKQDASHNSYHVFLSFRGEDTRKTFTDHLYNALMDAGFRTFRDDEGIQRGESINSELHRGIRESRSSIIVFSKNYASSRWCLNELLLILECRRTTNHVVLPVFYDVDPSDVKKQMDSFRKELEMHEEKGSEEEMIHRLKQWRSALGEAVELGGMVLKNQEDGHESKFIKEIIKVIGDKIHKTVPVLNHYLVGIRDRVGSLTYWLRDGSSKVGIAAICGMDGIGKTTIAKFAYNMNLRWFDGGSFLEGIRENSKGPDGLMNLQKKLMSDILQGPNLKIRSVDEGIAIIQDALSSIRVLIVLDDVDHIDQINAIFGAQNWFHPGSKIILTTRNEHVLRVSESYAVHDTRQSNEFCKVYNVKILDYDESCKLFNWYAFGHDYAAEGYTDESKRMVLYCGGLPLALKVLGSTLRGRVSIELWRSIIDKLKAIPNNQILEKLKISYDSLQDDHDRNLFLHIACFFIGRDKDCVIKILDGCQFYTLVGIENLIDRCVLSIDENNKLRMHQLLQDMGREIIRLESPEDPGKRSRLWHYKDSLNVIREKSGTKAIEGFFLDMPKESDSNHNAGKRKNSGKNDMEFEVDAFTMMQELKILILKNVQVIGNYSKFPRSLRLLSWEGFHHKSIPSSLSLDGVVALEMPYSSLKYFLTPGKFLGSLKILDLRHSYCLRSTPDFSWMPNLERLVLKHCTDLVEIHESIGCLCNLILLNLKGCKNLENLPKNISMLKCIETLNISGCVSIKKLPEMLEFKSLKVLLAEGLGINKLLSVSATTNAGVQQEYISSGMNTTSPITGISWTWFPRTLIRLSLSKCFLSDDDIPRDISFLSSLQELDLSDNLISALPDCIRHIKLKNLSVRSCRNLISLEELPGVETLDIRHCTSLEKVTYQSTEFCPRRISYGPRNTLLGDCPSLVEVEGWFKIQPLDTISENLIRAFGLNNMDILQKMEVVFSKLFQYTHTSSTIQGLYETGVFSIFIPGEAVPPCFSYRSDGSTMSLRVSTIPNHRVRGLNICVVYSKSDGKNLCINRDQSESVWFPDEHSPLLLTVTNIRKTSKFQYSPIGFTVPKDESDHMIWFCHLYTGDQLEQGDELCISVMVHHSFHVKECGVDFTQEQDSSIKPNAVPQPFQFESNNWTHLEASFSPDDATPGDINLAWTTFFQEIEITENVDTNKDDTGEGTKDIDMGHQQKQFNRGAALRRMLVFAAIGIFTFMFASRSVYRLEKKQADKQISAHQSTR